MAQTYGVVWRLELVSMHLSFLLHDFLLPMMESHLERDLFYMLLLQNFLLSGFDQETSAICNRCPLFYKNILYKTSLPISSECWCAMYFTNNIEIRWFVLQVSLKFAG